MAIAAYDSDLTATNSGEITDASNENNWDESSNAAWDDGGPPADETNFYIQGSECISAQFTKTGVHTIIYEHTTTITVDTDGAILIWCFWASPASLNTYANGGLRTVVGNGFGTFKAFKASGSDFEPNPLGGWYNYAIDPSLTADYTVGTSPASPWDFFGMAVAATAQARGYPFAVDAIRYGRCTLEVTEGQSGAYGTFTGMATFDFSSGEYYALFQEIYGSYRWQGLMSLGLAGTAVDFRDSNANIIVANTPKVSANFNKIEIRNTGSNIEWTNVQISSPGVNNTVAATASRGKFEMVDGATLAFLNCAFTDMDTFIFKKGTGICDIDVSTFRRCNLVTAGGGSFDGCTFEETNDTTKAISCASPAEAALISNCTFVSDGTGHAIEIGGTAANITLAGNIFTGYDQADPGTAANKAIYVNIASGSMTITVSGGSGLTQDSIRTAGATVTVNADVTVTFTGLKDNSEVRVYKVSDDSVVAGTEDATAGTTDNRTFSWSAPASTAVYYRIICFQPNDEIYEPIEVPSYTVPASDTSVAIIQRLDRNAEN